MTPPITRSIRCARSVFSIASALFLYMCAPDNVFIQPPYTKAGKPYG